jgi:hypothetical protein
MVFSPDQGPALLQLPPNLLTIEMFQLPNTKTGDCLT